MCFFCQNMLEIALELAKYDPTYEDLAAKFVEHFCMRDQSDGAPSRTSQDKPQKVKQMLT